ncbi:unnamed protein product [Microthlaspi erraticum]|uniref:F-box domain-containing protein n=1 Tax=Microthlaspi erraticum TaxID=1685480 RepID=A0A6D2HYM6_9BRAS|nr:unnamed protein product [Microthlaspi erraticum]
MVGEIFSRVPLTSLGAVRSTCKTWEALSRNHILGQKAARKSQFLEFMVKDFRVYSLRLDLQGVRNDELADASAKQISVPNHKVHTIHHFDGLFLFYPEGKDHSRLLVWNPYSGQTKLVKTTKSFCTFDAFALGYTDDNKNRNHKILRLFNSDYLNKGGPMEDHTEVYEFSTESWRVLDLDLNKLDTASGVSLKGNAYFFSHDITFEDGGGYAIDYERFLVCFDFTRERFGPRMPVPFHHEYPSIEIVSLYCVRDEKLAVLCSHEDTPEKIEIYISTTVEPNAVSWNTFLKLDLSLINGLPDGFPKDFSPLSFFIDEENKVAVFLDLDIINQHKYCYYEMVYIFGEDGFFKFVNTGLVWSPRTNPGMLVCSSYVSSLVQLRV